MKNLYNLWNSMIQRCHNRSRASYARHGAIGISVCDRWRGSFGLFCEDVGERPSASHTLDRIDNSGNYEPGNVRWATSKEQASNKSNNVIVDWWGEPVVLGLAAATLSMVYGVGYQCALGRLRASGLVASAASDSLANSGQRVVSPVAECGSISRYVNNGCRCEACVNANSAYRKEQRLRYRQNPR